MARYFETNQTGRGYGQEAERKRLQAEALRRRQAREQALDTPRRQAYVEALRASQPTVDKAVEEQFGLKPGAERPGVLPFRNRGGEGSQALVGGLASKSGLVRPKLDFTTPELGYQAARAYVSPGVALQGGDVSPEDALNVGFNLMGGAAGTSAALRNPAVGAGRTVGMAVPPKGVKPVRVYHGTNETFDLKDIKTPAMFSTKRDYAQNIGKNVHEADLTLNNPADLRAMNISPSDPNFAKIAEDLKAQGYDGAQYRNEAYVAFEPGQVTAVVPPDKVSKASKPKALGQLFDDVPTLAEAKAMALRGEHLRKPKGGEGSYIGAPEHITDEASLATQRGKFDRAVDRGAAIPGSKTWYENARDVAADYAPGDQRKQALLARGGAGYSSQLSPDQEMGGFIAQHNEKMLTGRDVKPYTPDKMENIKRAYPEGGPIDPDAIRLGPKTGAYGDARDPRKPIDELIRAPLDLWQGRAQGFAEGTSYGPTHHNYSWGENLAATDRANQRAAGGATGWHPVGTQAAAWVGGRKEDYIVNALRSASKAGKPITKPEELRKLVKEAEEYALGDIPAAANRNAAYLTKEARTGGSVGHLPMDDPKMIEDYTERVSAIGGGRDPIMDSLGLYSSGPRKTRGYYPNEAGQVEQNPGWANQVLVGSDLKGVPKTPEAERAALDLAARNYAFTHAQEAGAHSRFFPEGMGKQKVADMNAVLVKHNPLTDESWNALGASAGRAGASPVNWGNQTLLAKFGDEGPVPGTTGDIVKALRQGGVEGQGVRGTAETFYDTTKLGRADQAAPETGVATEKYLGDWEEAGRTIPDVEARTASAVANEAKALNVLDAEIERTTGKAQRAAIVKVRDILSQGGVPALREYVRKFGYAGLPAGAAMAVGYQLREADGQAGADGA